MIVLNETDKKLLEEVQLDFPLVPRPFDAIGKSCGISGQETMEKLRRFQEEGLIREISGIFNAGSLGYKSTLVAMQVREPAQAARKISLHPGVSHNYQREHSFNLWFTLTILQSRDFKEQIEELIQEEEVDSYLILPALRTFKIGVNFRFTSRGNEKRRNQTLKAPPLEDLPAYQPLIRRLQDKLEIVEEPWRMMMEELGYSEARFFQAVRELKAEKALKRISAVLRHRKAGFKANGMACFNISEQQIEAAGIAAAAFPEVSHCYQRPVFPQWHYSLFAMVHGETREQCNAVIKQITDAVPCSDQLTLYSTREFKKERVRFFLEE